MADKKISELDAATTPLAGTEVLAIVQEGETKQVAASEVAALSPGLTSAQLSTLAAADLMIAIQFGAL